MKTNQDYKNAALAALDGKWAPSVVCTIVISLVIGAVSAPSTYNSLMMTNMVSVGSGSLLAMSGISSAAVFLVLLPLTVGYAFAFYRLYKDGDAALTGNMLKDGTDGFLRNVWGMFLSSVYVIFWTIFLIIPGIVASLAYSMAPFILKDVPEISACKAIKLSRKMMHGHKWEFFKLQLSFIGWGILSLFTIGIGYLWLTPYMMTTIAAFYQDVKGEYIMQNGGLR